MGDVKGFTGVTEAIAVKGTLDMVLELDFKIKNVYVFGNKSLTYQANKASILEVIPHFEDKLDFHFFDESTIETAKSTLLSAPPKTIGLVVAFLHYDDGYSTSFQGIISWI